MMPALDVNVRSASGPQWRAAYQRGTTYNAAWTPTDEIVLDAQHDVIEWSYAMRHAAQCILPYLFLGSSDASRDIAQLHAHSITTVLLLRTPAEAPFVKPRFPQAFRYHIIEMRDDDTQNLISLVPQMCALIEQVRNAGERMLVHDDIGVSRAPAVVVLYLMHTFGVTYERALRHVQNRRFCVHLSDMFDQQCKAFEAICQARTLMRNDKGMDYDEISSARRKREADFDDDDDFRGNPLAMEGMLRR